VKVADILARLQGKSLAYDTPEEVAELLDDQHDRIHDGRLPSHLAGAARLSCQLAYQPGLVSLRGETYDSALYLEALLTAARSRGYTTLAEALEEAAVALHEATELLAAAVHATVPAPEAPLIQAA
jgi:hypothetical protein